MWGDEMERQMVQVEEAEMSGEITSEEARQERRQIEIDFGGPNNVV